MPGKKVKKTAPAPVQRSATTPAPKPVNVIPTVESASVATDSKVETVLGTGPNEKPETHIISTKETDAIGMPSTPLARTAVATLPQSEKSATDKSPVVPITPDTANASYSDLYSHLVEDSGFAKKYATNPLQTSNSKAYNLESVYAVESISPLRNAPEDELVNPVFNPRKKAAAVVPLTPEVPQVVEGSNSKDSSPSSDKVPFAYASSSTNAEKAIPIFINPNVTLKSRSSFTLKQEHTTTTTVVTSSSSSLHQQKYSSTCSGSGGSAHGRPSNSGLVESTGGENVFHLESASMVFDDIASEITEGSTTSAAGPVPTAVVATEEPYYPAPKPAYREQLLPSISEEEPRLYSLVDEFKDTVLSLLGFKTNCTPEDMTLLHKAATLLLDAALFFPLLWLSFYLWLFRLVWSVLTITATLVYSTVVWAVSAPFCLARSVYQSVTTALVTVLATVLSFVPGGSKIALQFSPHALRG